MRTRRIAGRWILLLSCTGSLAWSQGAALAQNALPRLEVFVEGGGSFLSDGSFGAYCQLGGCSTSPIGFSRGGRLFTGARFGLTRHDALEASYSYNPNPFPWPFESNRLDVISFNYVRYLGVRTRVQPFATAGIGANRFSRLPDLGFPSENGFRFAGNFGAGADFLLQRHVALRLELRDYVGAPPSFLSGTGHAIVPTTGLVLRFR